MLSLITSGLAFLATHVLLSSSRLRGNLRDQLGERGFLVLYSAVALATLAWFIAAYGRAPHVPLWQGPPGLRWIPIVVMPFATLLMIAGVTTPNPTAVGMERHGRADDPAPGILRVTRHPLMWAIGLWGLAHIPPNGDLASLVLFGAMAVLALGGTVLIDRKKRLALGSNWPRLAEVTSNLPFAAILAGRTRLKLGEIGLLRLLAALLLYAVLFLAHPLVVGVPVLIP